jgi:hypothetical protein
VVPVRDQVVPGAAPEQGQVVARVAGAAARAAVAGPAAAAAVAVAVAVVVVRAVVVVAGVSRRFARAGSVRCPQGGQTAPIGRRGRETSKETEA